MEKRLILFVVLTFAVFFGFQYIMPKKPQNKPEPPSTAQAEPKTETPAPPATAATPTATPAATAGDEDAASDSGGATAPTAVADTHAAAQKVVIDGDLYTAVLDNRGGVLTSWELKGYQTSRKSKDEPRRVFDMITGEAHNGRLYLGSLILGDAATETVANDEYYEVSVEGGGHGPAPEKLAPPVKVRLTFKRGDLQLEKVWSFDKDNYTADLRLSGTKAGKPLEGRLFLGEDIGPASEHFTSSTSRLAAVYSLGGKVKRETPDDPGDLKRFEGDVRWAGLEMQYFSLIAIPSRPLGYFNTQTVELKEAGLDGDTVKRDLLKVSLPLNPDGGEDYRLYIGPKKQENLQKAGTDLSGVIDYGMFTILVYPLLTALRWIHQFIHNYGWSIVALTFALSLVLFPLRLKSMLSMKKMSAIQPKVKAIQDKYRQYKATDPRKREMNTEVMALYKEHGVNPMSGCLPMIIQMPLLFAFYQLLAQSIDLRQAPFIWWLQDLSSKDPYYILPIAMGLTMFISQKMAPMSPSADPTQAKMMMIMPLFFTFFFFNMSSGLNLYFLCSNIFQVTFQKIAERWIPNAAAAPAKKGKGK
ncbi:MAG: membrane protein insertase YidC [Acidobacteriota bacterium]|jgi:YidC/Oxa1 family membrane protein insertase|nr:membrane protein insertase YidC [Acidobacteriota bacterium]